MPCPRPGRRAGSSALRSGRPCPRRERLAAAVEPHVAAAAPSAKPPLAPNAVFNDLYVALDLPEIFDRYDIIRVLGYVPARATLARALESLKDEGMIALETQSLGGSVNRFRKLVLEDD